MGWFEERFERRESRHRYDCISCGKGMWFPKCKHGKYKTCSKDCADSVSHKTSESKQRNCQTCGNLFKPRDRQVRMGQGMFCSQSCNTASKDALNTPESKSKAVAARRLMFANGEIKFKSGKDHHSWKGGKDVSHPKRLKYVADYKKNNKEKVRVWGANRRKKNVGKLPSDIIEKLKTLQKSKCPACMKSLSHGFHLDHIVPLSAGGLNEVGNVQLLCIKCNLTKSAKDPIKFMQEKGFLL